MMSSKNKNQTVSRPLLLVSTVLLLSRAPVVQAFSISAGQTQQQQQQQQLLSTIHPRHGAFQPLQARLSKKRQNQLGVDEDEDYDLSLALDGNTDPFITKVIAGSLIVVIFTLLFVGVIQPLTAEYDEGICNPLLTAGRC